MPHRTGSDVVTTSNKRASIYTLGCRLNQSETTILAEKLTDAGYEVVPFGQPSDLGIIHTCTVTHEADAKSRKAIRSFIRKNPGAFTIVIGCYAELNSKGIADIEGVNLVVGNRDKLNVLDYIKQAGSETPTVIHHPLTTDDFTIDVSGAMPIARRVNLKIQDGCDAMCSYCIVPIARGLPRSRNMDNLLDEARLRVEHGAREIVLTGVHVGRYAFEGHTLVEVVDQLNAIEGLARVRISSIETTRVPEALYERMKDPQHVLMPFLHVPMQSGSDRILRLMNRTYTGAEFRAFLDKANAAVPDLCLGTDILVGMPGEQEADFDASCRMLADTPLAYAHVFAYSARPGTPAADFSDKVPPPMLKARSKRLRAISDDKRRQFQARHAGKTVEVLFEHERNGKWTGYSGNYIRIATVSSEDLTNQIHSVVLEKPEGDLMIGRLEHG